MTLDVDLVRRTVAGPAIPYGPEAVCVNLGRRYRFQPGWARLVRPVRLLRDHDEAQRLGELLTLAETPDAMHVLARVRRGRAGDRALALAGEGRLWFSAGVELTATVPDPLNQGVRLVLGGDLVEITLTDRPAFDWR